MKKGFTLIELSIVIVVIGLIAGVVAVGSELRHRATVNSLLSDAERFRSSIINFKQKYGYYPGDFPKAEAIWGTLPSSGCVVGTNRADILTPTTATCNGSGNLVIGNALSCCGTQNNGTEFGERFYVWQHLANAGFIEGQYSGANLDSSSYAIAYPGINIPATKYRPGSAGSGYTITYDRTVHATESSANYRPVAGRLGHVFSWADGYNFPNDNSTTIAARLMNVTDARYIDSKVDDGLPYKGKIFTSIHNQAAYGTTNCVASNKYNAGSSTAACSQYWRLFLEEEGG